MASYWPIMDQYRVLFVLFHKENETELSFSAFHVYKGAIDHYIITIHTVSSSIFLYVRPFYFVALRWLMTVSRDFNSSIVVLVDSAGAISWTGSHISGRCQDQHIVRGLESSWINFCPWYEELLGLFVLADDDASAFSFLCDISSIKLNSSTGELVAWFGVKVYRFILFVHHEGGGRRDFHLPVKWEVLPVILLCSSSLLRSCSYAVVSCRDSPRDVPNT